MTTALVFLCIGLLIGAVAVWLILRERIAKAEASGQASGEVQRVALAEQLKAAQQALTGAEGQARERDAQAATSRAELDAVRGERAALEERVTRLPILETSLAELSTVRNAWMDEQRSLSNRIVELETTLEKERAQAQEKLELLKGAREALTDHFNSLASTILEAKGQQFTKLNQENLSVLLGPLQTQIDQFKNKVEEVYVNEGKDRFALIEQVRSLTQLNNALSLDTQNLTLALKGDSKAQGNWGEILLDDVLARSGLVEGQHYVRQEGVRGDDGLSHVIPDVVLHLPDDKHLGDKHFVIDSKLTLPDYRAFTASDDEGERAAALKKHLASIRAHIKGLSEKNYQALYGLNSIDFVVMFVPLEPAFMLAVTHDRELFEYAWERNVLLVSPSTLLFVVKTIAFLWRQEDLSRNAMDISRRGAAFYDRLVGFVAELQAVGDSLGAAQHSFDNARRKLSEDQGNVIRQAEMLRQLGVKPKKVRKSLPRMWVEAMGDDLQLREADAAPEDNTEDDA